MFYKKDLANYKEAFEGVTYKTLAWGDKTSLGEFILAKGCNVPAHSHPHEQMGHLLEGEGVLYVDEESIKIREGTSFQIPPHAPHNFDATGDHPAVLIEAFSPPREDYISRVEK